MPVRPYTGLKTLAETTLSILFEDLRTLFHVNAFTAPDTMVDPESEIIDAQSTQAYSRPVITSVTTKPPVAKVLALPELLIEILDHLPFQDLFSSSRTCGGFKDTINNTKTLREKLPCETFKMILLDASNRPVINSWLLCPLISAGQTPSYDPVRDDGVEDYTTALDIATSFAAEEYFANPETWRRVYITNPPFKLANITLELRLEHPSGRTLNAAASVVVRSRDGLTLGQLVDEVMASRMVEVFRSDGPEAQMGGKYYKMLRGTSLAERIRQGEVDMRVKPRVVEGRCCVCFPRDPDRKAKPSRMEDRRIPF
ncbi:hypothetical protein M409DRAFT_22544 [Zasmidium cellare ATCC 36951]|uniref:F-box domain-containing protein n=1 Tax=Zasmidium cellare ATCC 36951 TaxID=1080233 RepID=A0A6A6CLS7_ZASCE|nr:uncharacterized protein M409DRAFT_22544 [Zasmidium cellare ATCC 36951]KAF2167110.1 hypothetical protein M409DRAFT_22544 [Zasmidium cellare ATCC 36951]